jgi:membrane associated rhomboid family serine protease
MRRLHSESPVLELDACKPCWAVWFDAKEFESVPGEVIESQDNLILRGREALAMEKVRQLQEQQINAPEPDADWKTLPAAFGLPVETHTTALSRTPVLTWSLSLVILAVSVLAFFNLEAVVEHWGLVPAEFWRRGGLTLISAFLLHGGFWHLAGNLYFLLIFGDNVEDYLGRWRWLLLLAAATLAGDVAHILADPYSTIPCIGASGGISGIIVFYALAFPRARLSFLLRYFYVRFFWIQLPAWIALVLWIALQTWGAYAQVKGFSNVSALAHLGGAGAGFLAWLAWHRASTGSAGGNTQVEV